MKRATQRQAIFYRLLRQHRKGGEEAKRFIPVFELMGEIYIEEIGKWGYVSYECSARASEMIKMNPELIKRQQIRGRSGALYYGYRFCLEPKIEMIKDPDLLAFYQIIKRHYENKKMQGVRDPAPQHEQGEQVHGDSGPVHEVRHNSESVGVVGICDEQPHTAWSVEAHAEADDHGIQDRKGVEGEPWWLQN